MASDISNSSLNLTADEKRFYGQLFSQADSEGLGVVTGDVAVKFFERTKLDPTTLGEIWQLADTENRGLLTPGGFNIVLRLIGHCQAGQQPSFALARQPGPLPKFEGMGPPPQPATPTGAARTASPQLAGGPVRVPPLTPDKVSEYSMLFERAGAQNGFLGGEAAKQMFERARLSNEALGRIWNLSDTEQRGALNLTEFIIAMHLIASMRSGTLRALPQSLPPGLYEAAARRGPPPAAAGVPRPLTGQTAARTSSPLSRPQYRSPTMSAQSTGNEWLVTPQDKAKFDQIFATVDTNGAGYITGDQAVQFFSASGLSEDILASVWDLADINSEGRLNRDEFAVAMYLIRQQRGKTDDRGNIPATLPTLLIPPSMRQRPVPPQHPTAPAFDNAAFAPIQSQSASDDLFGLDALSSDTTTTQPARASPQASRSMHSPQVSGPQSPHTTGSSFKPFVPSSAFGQGLAQQHTGGSLPSTSPTSRGIQPVQGQRPAADDLLGDNDPEISSRLTEDTTQLANMSNQIGTLRNQMQEVQTQKSTTETNLATSSNHKRELETRLSQFRTQYEEEVRQVKSLEERLAASHNETRKLQQELAMLEGAHQDLKSQHEQVAAALEADQRENASLKERTRALNEEMVQLRPQLEKLRSEARQQKGMVAINKKQVATSEAEKEKLQGEVSDLERSNEEASRSLQASEEPVAASPSPPAASPPAQSTNPFFRMASQQSVDRNMSPSTFTQDFGQQQSQSAFDTFFGPSQSQSRPNEPPPTTFRSATPPETSRDLAETSTMSTSPQSTSYQESPSAGEPPAPPESRQITSSFLPFRSDLQRSESFSSSVKAIPPASRTGLSNTATPTKSAGSPTTSVDDGETPSTGVEPMPANQPEPVPADAAADQPSATSEPAAPPSEAFGHTLASQSSIPGSFPADTPTTPRSFAERGASQTSEQFTPAKDASKQSDFDSAFGSSESLQQGAGRETTSAGALPGAAEPAASTSASEFPPIQELRRDDSDSDSESEQGFEDDFAPTSPPRQVTQETIQDESSSARDTLPIPKPSVNELESGGSSQLPTPTQQQSPPTYDQTMQSPPGEERNVNQFPAEYGDLVPSREFATSEDRPTSTSPPAAEAPTSLNPFTSTNGVSQSRQTAFAADDFDSAFTDLTEAQVADEASHDNFIASRSEDTEFNPTFDSPAPSKVTTFAETPQSQSRETFSAFEPSFGASTKTQLFSQGPASQQDDWDQLFAGLDSSNNPTQNGDDPFDLGGTLAAPAAAAAQEAAPSQRPQPPGRALSAGTDHDDPILKSLTAMGYPRDDALDALEKFDYNLDKAADYLTSKT